MAIFFLEFRFYKTRFFCVIPIVFSGFGEKLLSILGHIFERFAASSEITCFYQKNAFCGVGNLVFTFFCI